MTMMEHRGPIWVGLDVHKDTIVAGVLDDRDPAPRLELIGSDDDVPAAGR